jgi:3',5'-cyclic AMP phosphodiesterase CpdA
VRLPKKVTRREALRHLGAGALLAFGLRPRSFGAEGESGSFRFIVVNDTHCLSLECERYLEGLVGQMKGANADFCLHAGDLTEKGERHYLRAVKEIFNGLGTPMYPVVGNHDYLTPSDSQPYEEVFPQRINYFFRHRGWQFVGLDSTDGQRYEKTAILPATFRWLDQHLGRLDKRAPTVIFTHFPLGPSVIFRPTNADDLLDRFREFNLRATFSGHFHGFTERERNGVVLVTNRCCALKRDNHDKTPEKGYFVCTASGGQMTRRFVEYKPA